MHTHVLNRSSSRRWSREAYAHFHLPDNPLCWLRGHSPRVRVIRPTYGYAWRKVDCRVCGRHWHGDTGASIDYWVDRAIRDGDTRPRYQVAQDVREEHLRRQIEVVEEHGATYVERGIERRQGWERQGTEEASVSLYLGRGVHDLGWSLGVGGLGSETPLDAALYVPGVSVYAKTSLGRRWAHLLTERLTPGGGGSREHEVLLSRGSRHDVVREPVLTVTAWGPKHEWHRDDPWWAKRVRWSLNPLDRLWGTARYSYEDVAGPHSAVVRMPDGDEHLVDVTLRRQTFGRPRGGRQQQSWSVDWRCDAGIPYRHHDWKGDTVHGSGVSVTDDAVRARRWVVDAVAAIAADVSRMRSREGWTLPDKPILTDGERKAAEVLAAAQRIRNARGVDPLSPEGGSTVVVDEPYAAKESPA